MLAIIDSIHSQVPGSIAGLNRRFDLVVSLDSHLDVSLGGDDRLYPESLRMIARRTGAHTAIREITGGLVVAIPERMLARHAADIESKLPPGLRVVNGAESVLSVVDFLQNERGIEIFQSPPRDLRELSRKVRGESWLLDIDVDYIQEMQDECYTRIIRPHPGVLQSMASVVDLARRSRPEAITLSEAKLAAIESRDSSFSKLLAELKDIGYKVERGHLAASDAEIVEGISVCNEFYRAVSKPLMLKHEGEMMRGDFRRFRSEERAAAKEFFSAKGYD